MTVAAAAKAGRFIDNVSAMAEEEAKDAGCGAGLAKISLADLGLSVQMLRPIPWNIALDDHTRKTSLFFDSVLLRPLQLWRRIKTRLLAANSCDSCSWVLTLRGTSTEFNMRHAGKTRLVVIVTILPLTR